MHKIVKKRPKTRFFDFLNLKGLSTKKYVKILKTKDKKTIIDVSANIEVLPFGYIFFE